MESLPFVISAELDAPDDTRTSYIQPSKLDAFRESLDADLRTMNKQPVWISRQAMTDNLDRFTRQTTLPVISLDDRYIRNADSYVGISRGIDINLRDSGYVPRAGYPSLQEQFRQLASYGGEVMLADDVLYSGEMISWLAERLRRINVAIGSVAVGIAIQEGVDKLASQGIDVVAGITFEDVEDELCERDLALVSGSGRRIAEHSMNALYFDSENGKPEQWASIPENFTEDFCRSSLERSLRLLNPTTPIEAIGAFRGYATSGTAQQVLTKRIGELQ